MKYEKNIRELGQKNERAKAQRHKVNLLLLAFCSFSILVIGCGKQPKEIIKEISIENTDVARAMQASEDVLGQMHFAIEKADYDIGYIRTRPLAGAQFFEVWRDENVGFENALLSNMHSIRRIVELNINQQDEDLEIDCDVRVQRLSLPQREITSSARAYQLFSRSTQIFQRLELHPELEEGMAWIELDRDSKLETEILKRISSKIDNKSQTTENKL